MGVGNLLSTKEVLKALSSDVNLRIIVTLGKLGGSNPRELAKLLGMCESDVSRRLSRLRKLGIVDCEWVRVGNKNVKVFKLRVSELTIDLVTGKVSTSRKLLSTLSDELLTKYLRSKVPEVRLFVGRHDELRRLRRSGSNVVIVTGLHGIGKTFLVANYLREYVKGPTYWINLSSADHAEDVVRRLAIYLSSLGRNELLNYINAGGNDVDIYVEIISEILSALNAHLVVDDYQKVSDPRLRELIASLARRLVGGKLIVISRRLPHELLTSLHNVLHIKLLGFNLMEAMELLRKLGVNLSKEEFSEVYASTRGHPLLLKMFADVVRNYGLSKAMEILSKGDLPKSLWSMIHKSLKPEERELLRVLSCINEPLPPEVIRELISSKYVIKYLYALEDYGLIEDFGGKFGINDLIREVALKAYHGGRVCREVYRSIAKLLTESSDFSELIRGLHYCVKSGDESLCVNGLRRRYWVIEHRLLEYLIPYYEVLKLLTKVIKSSEGLAYLNSELGIVLFNLGKYREAVNYMLRAKELFKSLGNEAMYLSVTSILMVLYLSIGDTELAKECAEEVESRFKLFEESTKDTVLVGKVGFTVYANLARLYSELGDLSKCYEDVVKEGKYAEMSGSLFFKALARFHLAVVKNLLGMREEVLEPLMDSYLGFKEEGLKAFASSAAMVLSKVLYELGMLGDAFRYASESFEGFKELKYFGKVCDSGAMLALLNNELGNHREAIQIIKDIRPTCVSGAGNALYVAASIIINASLGNCRESLQLLNKVGSELLRRAVGDVIYSKVSESISKCGAS